MTPEIQNYLVTCGLTGLHALTHSKSQKAVTTLFDGSRKVGNIETHTPTSFTRYHATQVSQDMAVGTFKRLTGTVFIYKVPDEICYYQLH